MFMSATRRTLLVLSVCIIASFPVRAQSSHPGFDRTMSHVDLGLSAPIEYTQTTSGSYGPYVVNNQQVSTASGVLAALRYTRSPLVGFEMNFKFTRFAQNYTYTPYSVITPQTLGVATTNKEISWGYVAHMPHSFHGVTPYGSAGLGTFELKPTANGGEGLQRQFRALYYWGLGADAPILDSHFGLRFQVRQLFYKAPDFGQNYLTSGARTTTFEPCIGFFARF